ncbi:MAG: ABC transporter ATP-binding protein [Acidimicrobiaceae bacterium]|nr:ABC transporter ATP-binding protein [Acidimicrobiaceae bacterium]
MVSAWGVLHSMSNDRSSLADKTVTAATRRRVWEFARRWRGWISAFMVTTIAATFLGLVAPLVIREIFDSAIAEGDGGYLNVLFGVLIAAALGEALLALLARRLSSGIGEGLIFDLRLGLFDHVQRMPLSFFTRTQTGTLVSRLNNDVIGAQRAFTGTLGTVVSNVITLGATLVTMFWLEWRLTLLAVVILPVFVLPARRVGKGLQAITREGMNLNASMNNTMTERFNVAGALLVKLFGRHDDEAADFADRAGRVRDIGIRSALYSQIFLIALTLVGAVGTALIYWLGGHLAIDGSLSAGTLVALGLYTVRIYVPLTSLSNARVDVMSAFVSFERVFEVLDSPNPITDRGDARELRRP